MICSYMTSICITIWWRSHCLKPWTCNGLQKNSQTVSDTAKNKKKNSKIQILKLLKDKKNIKKSDDLLLRNYWNKTKYIWLNNREI